MKPVDVVYITQQVLPSVIVDLKELDLDPFYQEDLGGPGSGHRGHRGIPGQQGGSLSRGVAGVPEMKPGWGVEVIDREQLWEEDHPFRHVGSTEGAETFIARDADGYIVAGCDLSIEKIKGEEVAWNEGYIHYIESDVKGGASQLMRGLFEKEKIDVLSGDAETADGAKFFKNWGFVQNISEEDSSYGYGGYIGVSPFLSSPKQNKIVGEIKKWFPEAELDLDPYYQEDLGGPGSGHHGHAGTKGSQGGSAPKASGAAVLMGKATGWGSFGYMKDVSKESLAGFAQTVPDSHIEGLRGFKFGKDDLIEEYNAQAYYDPDKSVIRSVSSCQQTIAHEIGHHVAHKVVGLKRVEEVSRGDYSKLRRMTNESAARSGIRRKEILGEGTDEFFAESYSLWARGIGSESKVFTKGRTFGELLTNYGQEFPSTAKELDSLFGKG